jgi:preprotein translocase subunit SecD
MNIRFKVMFIFLLVLFALWSIYPMHQKINLGLDLRGGIDLIYEVDTDELFKNMLGNKVEQLKQSLEKNNVVGATFKSEDNGNAFTITIAETSAENMKRADISLEVAAPAILAKSGNSWRLTIDKDKSKQSVSDAAAKAVEIIRNRIDQFGVKEPLISTMGESRIRIQLPGEKDIQKAIDVIGSTAQLQFRHMKRIAASLNDKIDEATEEIMPGTKEDPRSDSVPLYVLDKTVLLTGDYVVDARPSFDEAQRICVSMEFNAEGAKKFADITGKYLHQNIAIVLDGKVQTAPTVQSVIPNGRAQITGSFSDEIAQKYSIVLRAGSLPAPVRKASATLVGPSLGSDSIHKGVVSSLFGAGLVFVFMIIYYKFCGLIASFALTLNMLFLFAVMALLNSTLTLPGIAGIALTLGVAVDANVLIYERIKEELRAGKTVRAAIESGFDRAFSAIWDSNLTTLISGIALYYYGTGPIKGFAVTLSSGIVISMFTAIFVVKVILDLLLAGRKAKTISI